MLRNKKLKKFLAIFSMLVIFSGCARSNEGVNLELLEAEDTPYEEVLPTESEEPKTQIVVHVCGAVERPGVYYFSEDARIIAAIEAAGGFSEEASTDYLNLAAILSDGEQIYVPTTEEEERYRENKEDASQQLVDINTAGKEILMTLPGIGESRALDIISYREKEGAFGSVSDIMKVSGIKQSVFDKICDMICVK